MKSKLKKAILCLLAISILSLSVSFLSYTKIFKGIIKETNNEDIIFVVSQWGIIESGIICIFFALFIGFSLIFSWKHFGGLLEKYSWIGLFSSLTIFIVMSFYGNIIYKYITTSYQCGLAVIGLSCI